MKRLFLYLLVLCGSLSAQTNIYRSTQIGKTSALFTSASNNFSISGTTGTFASAIPDTVGPGDAIQYDSDGNGTIDAICFISSRASSTSVTVLTAAGGTPTAVTNDQDWGIYRAYTSAANSESRTENTGINATVRDFDAGTTYDLDANNLKLWVACYRGVDATFTINAWTTSVTDRVVYYTPTDADLPVTQRNPTSVYNSTRYFAIEISTANSAITVASGAPTTNIDFIGLQIKIVTGASALSAFFINAVTGDCRIEYCLLIGVDGGTTGTHHRGISWETSSTGTLYANNNIIYDFITASTGNDQGIRVSAGTAYTYNNTIANCAVGITRSGGTWTAKNVVAQSNTTDFSGTCTSCEDNVSDDGTAPGTGSSTSTSVTFADEANNDYFLASGDTGAKDVGTDYSADANNPITKDYVGTTRPSGASWDRGAHELIQATAGSRRVVIP